ncbi:alpha-galactosidase [Halobacteria archaeon AArc-curdl1]|uniref:Alpha-galactosidase n=1 Tax=Natronosalvus hydrolyticus TaxID=2979988 RepID=A0AAP3E7S7_9EURY|nr:alpha-galactosidase [Halobacteria archaeon AArc-curdl1]
MHNQSENGTSVGYDDDHSRIVIGRTDDEGPIFDGSVDVRPQGPEPSDASASALESEVSLETDVSLETSAGGVTVSMAITNTGEQPRSLDSLVFNFETADESPPFGPNSRIYRHGYQSWSPTATLPVGIRFPEESPNNAPMMLDLEAPKNRRTSSYLTGFVNGSGGAVTMGFLEHDRFCTRFDVRDDERGIHEVAAVCPFDGITLESGARLESATLWIDTTRSLEDGLATIADLVAEEMGARVPETVPTGWCSWYHYFTDVTEADVRENLEELKSWGIPVEIVQLDDGYMNAFGDWRTIDDDFDSMAGLAGDIESKGFTPGLWLAPFYVEAGSHLFQDHPEWFITDPETGDPVDGGFRAGDHLYGLDTTHPDVQPWLRETFETAVEEWGFQYLKLDFLFAAALPGSRYDDDVTRIEAYRTGMEIIDDTVGEDVTVLGCGAPLAPSVGLVDAMRIGPDTDPVWETVGESASQPALKNAVRNTLTRQFLHRRWWLNDPDCQLVRETSDLTTPERKAFAALVATTGGVNVFSDRITEIDPAGRRLLERSLPPVETGVVEGLADREFPTRVICDRTGDGATTVALFNWSDEQRAVSFDPQEYLEGTDATDDTTVVWDGFAGERLSEQPPIERDLAPHDAALFAIGDKEVIEASSPDSLTGSQ